MNRADLELIRTILQNDDSIFDICVVDEVEVLADRSAARIKATTQREGHEIVARLSWSICSNGGGVFQLPSAGDWVLAAYVTPDLAFVIARLSTVLDRIPTEVQLSDDTAVGSKDGTNLHLYSDTAVLIGKKNLLTPPDEPLVLGNTLKTFLDNVLTRIDAVLTLLQGSTQLTTTPGNPTAPNAATNLLIEAQRTALAADKLTYSTTALTNFLSQISYTERGAI